jgi:acyl dehydratase
MIQEQTMQPIKKLKGRFYEDFVLQQSFEHHWGRTLNAGDNSLFTSLTLHYNPLYMNAEYAKSLGHPDIVVNPYLVFDTVFGLSVEDLSEKGGAFLSIENLVFHTPVYPGDTITARSTVTALRQPASRPTHGIVTWHSEGFKQGGVKVLDYQRANLVLRREAM